MKELALPPRVRPGDAVALVSPSWFGAGAFPHRVGRGRAYLESLGLRLKVMPNALAMGDWTAGTPGQRADDLHAAFADSEVAVVLCAIGGNHSNELLDLLDYDLIRARPKVFQGLSDITVLHCALHRHAGLATFQSTCTRAWRWMGVAASRRDGKPHLRWLPRIALLACQGVAEWLDLEGCVLLLEPSEEAPSPAEVSSYLTDLRRLGALDQISGLVFSRPINYRVEDIPILWKVVRDATDGLGIPVLANFDCGHSDPMLTVPLGAVVRLDSTAGSLATTGAATVA